jgi:hypothetical protein
VFGLVYTCAGSVVDCRVETVDERFDEVLLLVEFVELFVDDLSEF